MQLLIIRHGDPDYSRDALTEKGTREAALLAERLQRAEIDDFYVSPLGRARDTAEPALLRLKKKPVVLDWLQEFPIRFLDPYMEREHIIWDYMPAFRRDHPLFEDRQRWMDDELFSMHDVRPLVEHVWQKLDELLAQYGYLREGDYYRVKNDKPCKKKAALVCHMGVGLILLSHLINISSQSLLHTAFLAPSSVTNVFTEEREKGLCQFRCVGIGDTSHLYAGNEPLSFSGFFEETQD